MTDFGTMLIEDRRLRLLQLLNRAGGSVNEHVLRTALRDLGGDISADRVRTELSWLADQGLVHTSKAGEIMVAEITERGSDAADGQVQVPGVRRPKPYERD